ncbi:MAG: zinc-ribbon domain-containing protein [Clostridiaceae bacterium]|nr:zinc-ribbon domain-containing protein [Clostridiaceae bacterium]
MAFLDDLKSAARNVAQKTGNMMEITRLNMSVAQERDKINRIFSEIGKAVYEEYKAGNDIGFGEKCSVIAEHENRIAELQQKILELKNVKKCHSCGKEVSKDTAYCPHCGAKQ